jgi:hypothetical protein
VRKSLTELYNFLKSYDYLEATTKIKSTIYEEAQRFLKTTTSTAVDSERQKIAESGEIPIFEDP